MDRNQKGSTIIIVVWFIAIIGVIATFSFYRTEVEWASVVNLENRQRFAQEAQIVLHERCLISSKKQDDAESSEKSGLLGLLVTDKTPYDTLNDPWYCHGRVDVEQDGYKITVLIEDEGSKPNLNTISDNGLQKLLKLVADSIVSPTTPIPTNTGGLQQPSSSPTGLPPIPSVSIDPVLDWRDIDDSVQRADGAKLSYYQSLNPPYKIRNGCFSSVEEIKLVKNGDKIYSLLAPEVTVFGLVNPNTIDGRTFARLLSSYGDFLSKGQLATLTDQFNQFRASKIPFTKMDDFLQLYSINIGTLDKIKPLFQFTGRCNINMATKNNLTVNLIEAGYFNDSTVLNNLIKSQKEAPSETIESAYKYFGYTPGRPGSPTLLVKPDDFFTTTSTIIRYKIWVTKGSSIYYLDTVWERQMVGIKKEWQLHPLSWRVLLNNAAPEIPILEDTETKNDDNK